jgi:hypothetical protein
LEPVMTMILPARRGMSVSGANEADEKGNMSVVVGEVDPVARAYLRSQRRPMRFCPILEDAEIRCHEGQGTQATTVRNRAFSNIEGWRLSGIPFCTRSVS